MKKINKKLYKITIDTIDYEESSSYSFLFYKQINMDEFLNYIKEWIKDTYENTVFADIHQHMNRYSLFKTFTSNSLYICSTKENLNNMIYFFNIIRDNFKIDSNLIYIGKNYNITNHSEIKSIVSSFFSNIIFNDDIFNLIHDNFKDSFIEWIEKKEYGKGYIKDNSNNLIFDLR